MNLVLEPSKCKSLSICAGKSSDIVFKLSEHDITSLQHSPETFLGIRIPSNDFQNEIFKYIYDGINGTLRNIDASLIRSEYKMKVLKEYLLPTIRFKLTVHELTASNLKQLDSLGDRFLKKWLSIQPSGTRAIQH